MTIDSEAIASKSQKQQRAKYESSREQRSR